MKRSWFGLLNSPPHTNMWDLWMTAWCAQRGVGLRSVVVVVGCVCCVCNYGSTKGC
jgi:hypothetical protein